MLRRARMVEHVKTSDIRSHADVHLTGEDPSATWVSPHLALLVRKFYHPNR